MLASAVPRYRPGYRNNEVGLICNHVWSGDSLALMGVAGVGKSNLVNFLRTQNTWRREYLGPIADCTVFPVVDCPSWEHTPESLWKMMLSALLAVTRSVAVEDDGVIVPFSEADRARGKLESRLRKICQEMQWHVMFILDDFDGVLAAGPLSMLESLCALRSDGNRGLLSYLVFTKRLPHVLGRFHSLGDGCKFYDLFKGTIYPLGPHTVEDTQQMLAHLNSMLPQPLSKRELAPIGALSGGHAQLLKVILGVCADRRLPPDAVAHLAAHVDVRRECMRLLRSLHPEEQHVALRLARAGLKRDDAPVVDHLARRGLVANRPPFDWFSPVFARFLLAVEESEISP